MLMAPYISAVLSGEISDRDLLDGTIWCPPRVMEQYPVLFLPRNPVAFVPAKGKVTITKPRQYPHLQPFRFIRLKPKGDRKDKAKPMRKFQGAVWMTLKDILLANGAQSKTGTLRVIQELVLAFEYSPPLTRRNASPTLQQFNMGLQSGGRSALRLLPKGRLLRIKGGELVDRLELFDGEIPRGASIESYVEDEMKAHTYFSKRTPAGFLPYHPIGLIDYRQQFNGSKVCAGLFEVKGDTRLDEILHLLRGTEEALQNLGAVKGRFRSISEQVKELSFCLGAIAGMRYSQLECTRTPWSMKEEPTNAHIGNMVVYDNAGKTTIGLCDLDAAGIPIRSKMRREDLLVRERENLMLDLDQAPLLSLPRDHKDNHMGYPGNGYRSVACQGFRYGYHRTTAPSLATEDVRKIIGLARAAEHLIRAEETLREHGLSEQSRFSFSFTRGKIQGFPCLDLYKRVRRTPSLL